MLRRISKVLLTLVLALSVVTAFGFAPSQDAYALAKKPKVTSVKLNHKVITIKKGKTLKLKAKVLPKKAAKKAKLTWSTSKKKVATVKNGKVKAAKKKTGKVKITVKVKGTKKKAVCTVYVGTPVKKVVLAKKALTLKTGETASVGAKVSPTKATVKKITYTSDNKEVATVDKKGNIKAVGEGTAVITAKPQDEAGKKATIKVTVQKADVPVTGVALDAAEKKIEMGQSFTLAATVAPADATNKAVTYASSDASVAAVDANGKVTGVKKGTADITVTTADGGKTAVCKVTVTFPMEMIISSTEEFTKDVIDAIKSGEIMRLLIKSDDNINIEIPKEDFGKDSLVIDAPKGHIENNAKFKDVLIKAISGSSYVEHTVGNDITYQANSGKIEIGEGASASVTVASGAQSLDLVNNGSVIGLNVDTKSQININGSSQGVIPVTVSANAGNSSISTSRELNIDTEAKVALNINAGGEYTQVNIVNKSTEVEATATVPIITGLGVITINNAGEHFQNVVAQSNGTASERKVTVDGSVSLAEGEAAAGAKLSLVPYTREMSLAQVKAATASYTATAANSGAYSIGNVSLGNYYLLAQKSGYADAVSKLVITSNSADRFNVASIMLIKSADVSKRGKLKGTITDAETGKAAESGLTLMLREGGNNVSGDVIATTTTVQDGAYSFSGSFGFGQYTIELVDKRANADSHYITTSFSANITVEGDNTANATASRIIKDEQVRFELRWGNEASGASADLDSHLVGPRADGKGVFHTWYGELTYSDSVDESDNGIVYADLDVDDTDYEGPETTTIYRKSSGVYSFYVQDYTNLENNKSTQMSRSSAVIRVYIGSRLMETYNIPTNMAGILYHVCDYDADRNKIISRNKMLPDWQGETSDVGLSEEDIMNNAILRLSDLIKDAEPMASALSAGELKTAGNNKIKAAKDALSSNDLQKIKDSYTELEDWNLRIRSALDTCVIDSEDITSSTREYWDNEDESLLYKELTLYGSSDKTPDYKSLKIIFGEPEVTYEWGTGTPDREGYLTTLTAKLGTYSQTWYVKYEPDLRIDAVSAIVSGGEDEEDSDLIYDWETDWEYNDNKERIDILYINGYTDKIPDNISIVPRNAIASVSAIKRSDKTGYDNMVTVSAGSTSRNYYIVYSVPSYIKFGFTITDKNGEELYYDESWLEDEDPCKEISIRGATENMPEFKLTPTHSGTTASSLKASDKDGYEGMITMTCGEDKLTYYISYSVDLGIGRILHTVEEDGQTYDDEISFSKTINESDKPVIRIWGSWDALPADLRYIPVSEKADVKFQTLTGGEYDGILTVSLGDESETYYVEYIPYDYLNFTVSSASDENIQLEYGDDEEEYLEEYDEYVTLGFIGGASETMPQDIEFIKSKHAESIEVSDYGEDGVTKLVTVRSHGDVSRTLVRYRMSDRFAFAFDLTVNDDIFGDQFEFDTDNWDTFNGDEMHIVVRGPYENLPENILTATARLDSAAAEVMPSEYSDYAAKVLVTKGDRTKSIYVYYEGTYIGDVDSETFDFDLVGPDGLCYSVTDHNEDYGYDWYYYIEDSYGVLPSGVEVSPLNSNVEVGEISETDEEGNPEMKFTLKYADHVKTVHISYSTPEVVEEQE